MQDVLYRAIPKWNAEGLNSSRSFLSKTKPKVSKTDKRGEEQNNNTTHDLSPSQMINELAPD